MANKADLKAVVAAQGQDPEIAEATGNEAVIQGWLKHHAQTQFARAVKDATQAERLARVVQTTLKQNPKLAACEPSTFMGAAMQCAALNLEPGPMDQVYFIPRARRFKDNRGQWQSVDEVNFHLGYKGMAELMMRHRDVQSVHAGAVHDGDPFEMTVGTQPVFRHSVNPDGPTRGEVLGYYAFVSLTNGGGVPEYKPIEQIYEEHRDRSDAWQWAEHGDKNKGGGKQNSPWHVDTPAMCKKSMVRVVFALAPRSIDAAIAMDLDGRVIHSASAPEDVSHNELEVADVPVLEPAADSGDKVSRPDVPVRIVNPDGGDDSESDAVEITEVAQTDAGGDGMGSWDGDRLIAVAKARGHVGVSVRKTAPARTLQAINSVTGGSWESLDAIVAAGEGGNAAQALKDNAPDTGGK